MTTEKNLEFKEINIFVVYSDESCNFYNHLTFSDFSQFLRRLLLDNNISSYEELANKLNNNISAERIGDFILENNNPTIEEFKILAEFFKISPEAFEEYRAQKQKEKHRPEEIENFFKVDDKSPLRMDEEIIELNNLNLDNDEFDELEKILAE